MFKLTVNIYCQIVVKYSGKIYLPYGDEDYILQGKKTSTPLKSPITVYVGDGSDDGFNSVVVRSTIQILTF